MLQLDDDQRALAESVQRLLSDAGLPRSGYGEPREAHDVLWQRLSDLGVVGALAPDSAGGLGLTLRDVSGVLVELGRACYPGPFISSAVAASTLLSELGATDLLNKVATGDCIAVVVDDRGTLMADAPAADLFLVAGGHTVSVVEGASVTPVETVDLSRSFGRVTPSGAQGRVLSSSGAEAIAAARDAALLAWVTDGLGAARAIFDLAREHAMTRVQFGVPIGSFQAVQHALVDAYGVLEAAKVAIETALAAAASSDAAERHRTVTMAAAWCCDGFVQVATTAIQTLGGIGFTWEHGAQLYYKRLLSLQTAYGGTTGQLEQLASLTLP